MIENMRANIEKKARERRLVAAIACDNCGEWFIKSKSRIKPHNFCCRQCLAEFSRKTNPKYKTLKDYSGVSKHMSALNKELNPTRMTEATREKLHLARLKAGDGSEYYRKCYGRHEHRIVAERLLGRPLQQHEIVHHIDGDKRNNDPENLLVMSQSEHASLHHWLKTLKKYQTVEEVVPRVFQAAYVSAIRDQQNRK